jgi:hypothetical protein
MTLEQDQQPGRQGFGSFSQSEKPDEPPGDCGHLATARDSKLRAYTAVLQFQYSRISDEIITLCRQPGLFPQDTDIHEHPENLLEHGHACPSVSNEIDGSGWSGMDGTELFSGVTGEAV